jgi:hypothetical protein
MSAIGAIGGALDFLTGAIGEVLDAGLRSVPLPEESNEANNSARVVVRLPFHDSNAGCPGAKPLDTGGRAWGTTRGPDAQMPASGSDRSAAMTRRPG